MLLWACFEMHFLFLSFSPFLKGICKLWSVNDIEPVEKARNWDLDDHCFSHQDCPAWGVLDSAVPLSSLCFCLIGKFVRDIRNMNTVEHNRVFISIFSKYCIMNSNSFESQFQIPPKETDRTLSIGHEDVSLQLGWPEWICFPFVDVQQEIKRELLASWRLEMKIYLFLIDIYYQA